MKYCSLFLNFIQLYSFSFLEEFAIKSESDSLFNIKFLDAIIDWIQKIFLKTVDLSPLFIFFIMLVIVYVLACVILLSCLCQCKKDNDDCSCDCGEFCYSLFYLSTFCCFFDCCFSDYCKECCYSCEYSCRRCTLRRLFNYYESYEECDCMGLRVKFKYNSEKCECCGCNYWINSSFQECECCSLKFDYSFLDHFPFIVKSVLYDILYIPILSALIQVFICTYHCEYNPQTMNGSDAYPPLDALTEISCNSPEQIACFVFSYFEIAFFHIRASFYVCYELHSVYSGDTTTNRNFHYFQQIGKVWFFIY